MPKIEFSYSDVDLVDEINSNMKEVTIHDVPGEMNKSNWGIAAASVRGSSHKKSGLPCQDAHGYELLNNSTVVLAVADGLGSATYSHIGANYAVQQIIASLRKNIKGTPDTETAWVALMKQSFSETHFSLSELSNREVRPLSDYHTTLIVAVLTDDWIITGHIGDGAAVIQLHNGTLETVSPPLKTEYANETVSLTQLNALELVKYSAKNVKVTAVAMISDGLQNLSLMSDSTPFDRFFFPFFKRLTDIQSGADSYQASQSIADFLSSERICAKTDDDKTLLLVGRKAQ